MQWHWWGDWRSWSREDGGAMCLVSADVEWFRDSGEVYVSVALVGLHVSVLWAYAPGAPR